MRAGGGEDPLLPGARLFLEAFCGFQLRGRDSVEGIGILSTLFYLTRRKRGAKKTERKTKRRKIPG